MEHCLNIVSKTLPQGKQKYEVYLPKKMFSFNYVFIVLVFFLELLLYPTNLINITCNAQ